MRRWFRDPAAFVAAASAVLSAYASISTYYNPHLESSPNAPVTVVSVAVLIAGTSAIAFACPWAAIRCAGQSLRAARGGALLRALAGFALTIPAAGLAVVAAGVGDRFVLADWRLSLALLPVAIAAPIVWRVGERRGGPPGEIASPGASHPWRAIAAVSALLLLSYPWLAFTTSMRTSAAEMRLSESVLLAARSGRAELRLADHVTTNRRFACLIDDRRTRQDIERATGARYRGPWHDGSDTRQLVLLDPDGQGNTLYFFGGVVEVPAEAPICLPVANAYVRLSVARGPGLTPTITASLHEK
jgi:hypothetical protein